VDLPLCPLAWIGIATALVVLVVAAIVTKKAWLSWTAWIVVPLALLTVLTVGLARGSEGDGIDCHFSQGKKDLGSTKPILWEATVKANSKMTISLDDYVDEERTGRIPVSLKATKKGRGKLLGKHARVGAFIRGGALSDGQRDIGFPVIARAVREPDGHGLKVVVCAARDKPRAKSRPGLYKGIVRVSGANIASAEIPVEIRVKAARTELILFALFIAVLGAGLTAATARRSTAEEATTPRHTALDRALALLPFMSGVVAGVVAGIVVYIDDPTFGAQRGKDMAKLLTITFAAATAGLAVTSAPARVARNRLPTQDVGEGRGTKQNRDQEQPG
jgi:hypothetical protein